MWRLIFSAFSALLLGSNCLSAAVVGDCAEASLRAAIQTGEPVVFGCDGVITLSSTIVVTNLVLDARGRNVIIDGQDSNRLFEVRGGKLTLWNLSLVNGRMPTGGAILASPFSKVEAHACYFRSNTAHAANGLLSGGGGAIFGYQASVVLSNCVFDANSANDGGAIYGTSTWVLAADCTFVNNVASRIPADSNSAGRSVGGAIYLWVGNLTAVRSVWRNNSSSAIGGAIYGWYSTLIDCRFEGNTAGPTERAVGGAHYGSVAVVSNCYFSDNLARGFAGGFAEGGAVYQDTYAGEIVNSTFVRNRALAGAYIVGTSGNHASGGAIYTQGGRTGVVMRVDNCTFGFNEAKGNGRPGRGGAIFHAGRLLTIQFSTIASNSVNNEIPNGFESSLGGGLGTTNGSGTLRLAASILSGNMADGAAQNAFGAGADLSYNLSSDDTPSFLGTSSLRSVDPGLQPLSDNGGPAPTFALRATSPAIDFARTNAFPDHDLRGVPRPQGGFADAGAYEQTYMTIQREQGSTVRIRYTGVPGKLYTLEAAQTGQSWTPAGSGVADDQGGLLFSEENTDADHTWYRVSFTP